MINPTLIILDIPVLVGIKKLSKEEEKILRSFADVRGEKANEAHVKGQDGSIFSKLKGVFHK